MKNLTSFRKLAVVATLLCASASSHASLIYKGSVINSGSGFGNVATLLTLDNTGGMSTGGVTRNSGTDVLSGNLQGGATANGTHAFSELNITDASQIKLIFNASEPGNANNSINLNALTLSIYSATGNTALFSTSLAAGQFFSTTSNTQGSIGYLFALDALSTTAAKSFISGSNRIGLSSTISMATGGPDRLLVSILDAAPASVPEPASMLLLGLGMAGFAAARRRKA